MDKPVIGVIACEVLRLEVESLRPEDVVCVFMRQDLHNQPEMLRGALREALAQMEAAHPQLTDIVLAYGLCSKAIEGVRTARCRLIIPRAHDCITLLMGDRHEYARYLAAHPGTYWYSPGWNATGTQPGPQRYARAYEDYLLRFDEDDAQYLMETEQSWLREYSRATYVDVGVGDRAAGLAYARECADWLRWEYDLYPGDSSLLRDLLRGEWDGERFLVLARGETAVQTLDERVIVAAPADAELTPPA